MTIAEVIDRNPDCEMQLTMDNTLLVISPRGVVVESYTVDGAELTPTNTPGVFEIK